MESGCIPLQLPEELIEVKHCILSSPIVALIFLLIVGFFHVPAALSAVTADAEQWEITADKMTRFEDPPSLVAEGNVILEKKEIVTSTRAAAPPSRWDDLLGEDVEEKPAEEDETEAETYTQTTVVTTIKADWMTYDIDLGQVRARGNVLIDIGPDRLQAESGSINLNDATGTFENASIIREHMDMHLQGRVIEKTGEVTYHIEDGWIITCKLKEGQTPPWSFAAADTKITDGGYAFLKHVTFRIKDVPILYTPYMILPAKRQRQTGFLFPSLYLSDRDGTGVETPFFINISPNMDMTLYPRYMVNRGLMTGAEFRYIADENSKGMFMGNYLYDDLSDPSEVEYYRDGRFTHDNKDRYWLRGKADQNFGAWITRLDLEVVSDNDYLREFNGGPTGITTTQERYLDTFGRGFRDRNNDFRDNTFNVLRSWDNGSSLRGDLLLVNDVSDRTYSPDRPSATWKLPSLSYSGLMQVDALQGTDFSWDTEYVNFWREEGVGAHRFDLFPRLSVAVPLTPYLETTVKGGVRDTLYLIQDNGATAWQDTDSENRFLYTLGGEVGTTMMRDFGVSMGVIDTLNHTLRPFVAYSYTDIPNKVTSPEFDSVDTLGEENIIFYGINNFFDASGSRNGRSFERQYAYLKVQQGYDLRSEQSDEPFTDLSFDVGLYPRQAMRLRYRTDIDMYGDGAYLHSVEGGYNSTRGDRYYLDYRYNSRNDTNSITGGTWYHLPYHLVVGYRIERAIEASQTLEETFSLRYQPGCWSVEFSSESTPGDQTVMVTFNLAHIGSPLGFNIPGY
jgi:LPS-assembly protein